MSFLQVEGALGRKQWLSRIKKKVLQMQKEASEVTGPASIPQSGFSVLQRNFLCLLVQGLSMCTG